MSVTGRRVLAVVLALVGVVWLGQGINLIPGSVMTGDGRWAVAGVVLLAVAVWLWRSLSSESDGS